MEENEELHDEPDDDVPDGEEFDDEYEDEEDDDLPRRAPWHFKIILVGTVIYLGYRTYQGISWLVHHA